jgi:hypothetical protein
MPRAFIHIDVTIAVSATPQNLGASLSVAQLQLLLGSEVVLALQTGSPQPAPHAPATIDQIAEKFSARMLSFQAHTANAGAVFIGGNSSVTSSSWGWFIPIPSTSVPAPPLLLDAEGSVKLTDFWISGTAGDVLHLMIHAW